MIKADYSRIASYYDKGRALSEQNMVMWLNLIAELSGASTMAKVLDLGCGTGRFSIPMMTRLGFDVTGADSSVEMLARAKNKDFGCDVTWEFAEANALPFPACSFAVVFISHLLHHVDHPLTVLKECHRVLGPSGVILIRHGTMDQIRDDVEHTFFPQAVEIDEQRIFSHERMEEWLRDAGFINISSQEVMQQTFQTGMAHLEAARGKNTSILSMISEESFQTGIRRFEKYVKKHSTDKWLLFDRMTLTIGHRKD